MKPPQKSEQRRSDDGYEYGADFYRFMASFAVPSARRIVPRLTDAFAVNSVVDFGCGHGAWLSVWADAGASVCGVDGAYVDARLLLMDPACFRAADLGEAIDLGSKFTLVQSLEVAEHLPAASAEMFVDTLVAHGAYILFSAATPGQGGEHHVNEQPLEYWRAIFRTRGYVAVDYLRPLIFGDTAIARWYRYNIMLYIKDDMIATLPERMRSCRVCDAQPLRDYRPISYRLRNALVRRIPASTVDQVSRVKGLLAARMARL